MLSILKRNKGEEETVKMDWNRKKAIGVGLWFTLEFFVLIYFVCHDCITDCPSFTPALYIFYVWTYLLIILNLSICAGIWYCVLKNRQWNRLLVNSIYLFCAAIFIPCAVKWISMAMGNRDIIILIITLFVLSLNFPIALKTRNLFVKSKYSKERLCAVWLLFTNLSIFFLVQILLFQALMYIRVSKFTCDDFLYYMGSSVIFLAVAICSFLILRHLPNIPTGLRSFIVFYSSLFYWSLGFLSDGLYG